MPSGHSSTPVAPKGGCLRVAGLLCGTGLFSAMRYTWAGPACSRLPPLPPQQGACAGLARGTVTWHVGASSTSPLVPVSLSVNWSEAPGQANYPGLSHSGCHCGSSQLLPMGDTSLSDGGCGVEVFLPPRGLLRRGWRVLGPSGCPGPRLANTARSRPFLVLGMQQVGPPPEGR